MIHDENGDSLETATNLKARFEALQMQDTTPPPVRQKKFQVKRFKVKILVYQYPQNTNFDSFRYLTLLHLTSIFLQ